MYARFRNTPKIEPSKLQNKHIKNMIQRGVGCLVVKVKNACKEGQEPEVGVAARLWEARN